MDTIFTYTKRIKDISIIKKEILDSRDSRKIHEIVNKVLDLSGSSVHRIDEIGLRTNPKKWIESIIKNPNKILHNSDMDNLLFDFTESMMTRMREDTKYALGIIFGDSLLLCHSQYGEETITPEWQIIPRMLDVDNILRYVFFANKDGEITVTYWEKEATISFIEWLGLTRKEAFLFGGKYRICSEIENYKMEFQLTESEIDSLLEKHPEFAEGRINFFPLLQYVNVEKVRIARNSYDNVGDFIQDFKAEKFGVPKYKKAYDLIKENHLPLITAYFDEKDQVIRHEGDENVMEINKDSGPFSILFADGVILFRDSYLDHLTKNFLNSDVLRVFHAGMKFKSDPVSLFGMEVYNQIHVNEVTTILNSYFSEINLQDVSLNIIFKYIGMKLVSEFDRKSPISYFFSELSGKLLKEIAIQRKVVKTEDDLIEYKSRDFVAGDDKVIISKLSEDITKKIVSSKCKVYLIGIEDDGTIDPINTSRFASDRIEKIRKGIQEKLTAVSIDAFPIISNGKLLLLLLVFAGEN